jgi:SAM-dependent methyltransferase
MPIPEVEKQRAHYKQFIEDNPKGNYKTTGWSSREVQDLSYRSVEVMYSGNNVLSVGCGYGKYYGDGIDILPEMVEMAIKNGLNVEVADIMTYKPKKDYDICIAVGTFNLSDDNYLYKAMGKMLDIAKEGIVVNMLWDNAKEKQPNLYYRDPLEVYKECAKRFSNKIKIDTTFLDHCFTIGVFK